MTAQSPEPGAEALGAPTLGGRGVGAGLPVPGATVSSPEVRLEEQQALLTAEQLEQINEVSRNAAERLDEMLGEAWEKLEEACMPIVDIAQYTRPNGPYDAWLKYAIEVYEYLAIGVGRDYVAEYIAEDVMDTSISNVEKRVKTMDGLKLKARLESMERVINSCDGKQKLIDFAPVESSIEEAIEEAEEKEDEDMLELLRELREMTVEEFTASGRDIVKRLERRKYRLLVHDIYEAIDYQSRFSDVIGEELENLAIEILGATEDQANKLVRCLVEC